MRKDNENTVQCDYVTLVFTLVSLLTMMLEMFYHMVFMIAFTSTNTFSRFAAIFSAF